MVSTADKYILDLYSEFTKYWNPRVVNLNADVRTPEEKDKNGSLLCVIFLSGVSLDLLKLMFKIIDYQEENDVLYSKHAYEEIKVVVPTLLAKHDSMVGYINNLLSSGILDIETENEIYDLYTAFGARCMLLKRLYTTVKVKESTNILSIVSAALEASNLPFTPTITSSSDNDINITLTPNEPAPEPTISKSENEQITEAIVSPEPKKRGRKKKQSEETPEQENKESDGPKKRGRKKKEMPQKDDKNANHV